MARYHVTMRKSVNLSATGHNLTYLPQGDNPEITSLRCPTNRNLVARQLLFFMLPLLKSSSGFILRPPQGVAADHMVRRRVTNADPTLRKRS